MYTLRPFLLILKTLSLVTTSILNLLYNKFFLPVSCGCHYCLQMCFYSVKFRTSSLPSEVTIAFNNYHHAPHPPRVLLPALLILLAVLSWLFLYHLIEKEFLGKEKMVFISWDPILLLLFVFVFFGLAIHE